jgi:hypothetical protein
MRDPYCVKALYRGENAPNMRAEASIRLYVNLGSIREPAVMKSRALTDEAATTNDQR